MAPSDAGVVEVGARLNRERPLPVIESLQAAAAVADGLTFVTRNVQELKGVEAPLLNPFELDRCSRSGGGSLGSIRGSAILAGVKEAQDMD